MTYHVSPEGPRVCKAKNGGCPYDKAGKPHFETQSEAQAHYENVMEEQFGATKTISRGEKLRQASYKTSDNISRGVRTGASRVAYQAKVGRNAAYETLKNKTEESKPYVKASARIAKKVSIMFARDVSRNAKKLDEKYQIRERTRRAINRASEVSKAYIRKRIKLISRIARQEMEIARGMSPNEAGPKRKPINFYSSTEAVDSKAQHAIKFPPLKDSENKRIKTFESSGSFPKKENKQSEDSLQQASHQDQKILTTNS